jgi:hypothetical protein
VGRFSRHIPKPDRITIDQARVQLRLLLTGCSDVALGAMTAESLASTHRVPIKECEYELTIARQRRAARA